MAFSNYANRLRLKSRILGRVQALPRSIAKRFQPVSNSIPRKIPKKLVGFGFLVLAGILGIWANDIAKNEALLAWEKTHLPSDQIFSFAMGSRGILEVKEVRKLQQVNRFLPSSLDEGGSIWISHDSNWIAFYSNTQEAIQVKIYCLVCSEIPKKWQPLGFGWKGLESAIEAIDRQIAKMKKHIPSKKRAIPRDPREILY